MRLSALLLSLLAAASLHSYGEPAASPRGEVAKTWDQAFARITPVSSRVSRKEELNGKVVTGYQGWFGAEGDGSGLGWKHYGGKNLGPGDCRFDLWPDVDGLPDDGKYPTRFKNADGSQAALFSSYHPGTVSTHFRWMKEHGIDGVMLQRFGAELRSPQSYDFNTAVMDNVRRGAEEYGRSWAVMYDLSGMKGEELFPLITEDWKRLTQQGGILRDSGYLHHGGKPLIAIWGVGFNDNRAYSLSDCGKLIDFFKNESHAVMLGIPYYWREQNRDALTDPVLHATLKKADILSPWAVGRYKGTDTVRKSLPTMLAADLLWAQQNKVSYLPVIFPGFSWHNLEKSRGREAPQNAIPREGGTFLWQQAAEARKAGASMIYVAMFDEVDEGTAIFKGSNHPPVGESPFMTYENLPADHYLWLTGEIGKIFRSPVQEDFPMPRR